REAAPPRLIIHGDYGPYNLFFKRGVPVVVLDFELARSDWRLTDLAKSLSYFAKNRLGLNIQKMKQFLGAYQTYCPVAADELRFLPTVWQFLTLRRLVVCWSRYCNTGSKNWLLEAQHNLNLNSFLMVNQDRLYNLNKIN
ncbi:MAG: phosphotransferase enzyme family protein, partial [Planctomycetota bacterium]